MRESFTYGSVGGALGNRCFYPEKMKLMKWRCEACGFEWFEPPHTGEIECSIDHGCPQGCDDGGKIVDRVKAVIVRTRY